MVTIFLRDMSNFPKIVELPTRLWSGREGDKEKMSRQVRQCKGVSLCAARDGWLVRGSTGKRRSRQAWSPPASGRIREMPCLRNRSATRALVASFGQEQ